PHRHRAGRQAEAEGHGAPPAGSRRVLDRAQAARELGAGGRRRHLRRRRQHLRLPRGEERRHAVEDRQGLPRRRQRLPEDLRAQPRPALRPRQDPGRAEAEAAAAPLSTHSNSPGSDARVAPPLRMHIPFARRTLANGLDAIVHEDHALPIVDVNSWYHVGPKNERVGRTGFAHLFEHLMFEGSAHHDSGYFAPLQRAGASVNGSTSADRTNYWEVIPVGALELALWLESDRMGFLLPALTAQKFETQREVVLNERRQNYENRPYGMASIALANALYDEAHPYRWPTIGYADDLRAATLDEVHAFFARYYHPANASLVLAGDIDTEAAFALAERYFADI